MEALKKIKGSPVQMMVLVLPPTLQYSFLLDFGHIYIKWSHLKAVYCSPCLDIGIELLWIDCVYFSSTTINIYASIFMTWAPILEQKTTLNLIHPPLTKEPRGIVLLFLVYSNSVLFKTFCFKLYLNGKGNDSVGDISHFWMWLNCNAQYPSRYQMFIIPIHVLNVVITEKQSNQEQSELQFLIQKASRVINMNDQGFMEQTAKQQLNHLQIY